jgi:hypothetical protein
MNYERENYGPGAIAALPPTIGLTGRAPTIGAALPGEPIGSRWSHLGTNGNGGNLGLLPVGIGLALGGLLYLMFTKDRPARGLGGMRANPLTERQRMQRARRRMRTPRPKKPGPGYHWVAPHLRKIKGRRARKLIPGYWAADPGRA